MRAVGAKYLSADEHREVLSAAGYDAVELRDNREWLCVTARRPAVSPLRGETRTAREQSAEA